MLDEPAHHPSERLRQILDAREVCVCDQALSLGLTQAGDHLSNEPFAVKTKLANAASVGCSNPSFRFESIESLAESI